MYKQRLFKMANACFNELEREDLIKLMIKKEDNRKKIGYRKEINIS